MNPSITSKEVILGVCRRLVAEKGLAAINMRSVAQECGVTLGALYNYYTDKDALLLAVVEDIWKEIFHRGQECRTGLSFPEHVGYLFDCVQQGAARYPDFFAGHPLRLAKARRGGARSTREHYFGHMKAGLDFQKDKKFRVFMITYNIGVPLTALMLLVRGVTQVLGMELSKGSSASISGIAGIGHILTGVGMILLLLAQKKAAAKQEASLH